MRKYFRSQKRKDHSEDRGVYGRIILKWILTEMFFEGVDWIYLA
jgi:hypothetical protein